MSAVRAEGYVGHISVATRGGAAINAPGVRQPRTPLFVTHRAIRHVATAAVHQYVVTVNVLVH